MDFKWIKSVFCFFMVGWFGLLGQGYFTGSTV